MIENVLRDYLADALDVPVFLVNPEPERQPDIYVLVEKTGSGEEDMITTSTFAIQSFAKERLADAAVLNVAVRNVMEQAITLDEITDVQLNSDYNFTDTGTKRPRYQAVYEVTHY